jgi:hypothetical protein
MVWKFQIQATIPYSKHRPSIPRIPHEISSSLWEVVAHGAARISFILRFGTTSALVPDRQKGRASMTGSKHDDRWRELCEAIVREPDSKRLMELVEKLNRELEERDEKISANAATT